MLINDLLESIVSRDSKIPRSPSTTSQSRLTSLGMDQYYEYYRFLVSIAGWPEETNIPIEGPIRDGPMMAPYTSQEREHVIQVLKKMGKQVHEVPSKPTIDPEFPVTSSPVRAFREFD